jgi:hypothetical protein
VTQGQPQPWRSARGVTAIVNHGPAFLPLHSRPLQPKRPPPTRAHPPFPPPPPSHDIPTIPPALLPSTWISAVPCDSRLRRLAIPLSAALGPVHHTLTRRAAQLQSLAPLPLRPRLPLTLTLPVTYRASLDTSTHHRQRTAIATATAPSPTASALLRCMTASRLCPEFSS